MTKMHLTKFEVAERQLLQAITLFFRDEDAVSVRTLAEAASQVLSDIGGKHGVTSFLRKAEIIKEEHKKEFLNLLFKVKNFFKHADRDKDEAIDFDPDWNEYPLLDCANMHVSIKKAWVPETFVFLIWYGIKHPSHMREGTDLHKVYEQLRNSIGLPNCDNKEELYDYIVMLRSGEFPNGNIRLDYGLTK